MARKPVPEIVKGTVLAIPSAGGGWSLAQVLVPGILFYLGAAPVRFLELPSADRIGRVPLTIFSWTNDAEVFRGRWRVLGYHALVSSDSPPIEYKVTISGKVMVESFDGKSFREYNEQNDQNLNYRKSRSPLLFEDMVNAAVTDGTT